MKKRIISLLLVMLMLVGMLPTVSSAAEADDPFTVVVSMEGLTLGQGLYFAPKAYTLDEINTLVKTQDYGPYTKDTLTAGMATLAFLLDHGVEYTMTGTWESGAYLSSVKGIDKGTVNIPAVITENGGPSNDENEGNDDAYLGEFDYSMMSGWMLTVNDFMLDAGCADWRFTDTENTPKYLSDLGNTYVVRWQFTLWGYGSDLGVDNSSWGMGAPYFTASKKAPLYAAYAKSTDSEKKAAARTVMENLTASQEDVDSALAALTRIEPPKDSRTVTVKAAPSTVNVAFYDGEDAWAYVTDNGVKGNYHEYVLEAPAGTYSYRATDGETDLGGMEFTVGSEDEQSITLVRTNFYTTNKAVAAIGDYTIEVLPGSMAPVVNGAQYIDASARVVTPTLLWANGNAMLYNWTVTLNDTLADSYGVAVSVNNTLAATLSAAQNKTFTLANLVSYRIIAPEDASVKMFNQIKNFNVEEIRETSQSAADGGMIEHIFRVAESSNLTYRVSMDGKITRAGYMGTTEKSNPVEITFNDSENPKSTENVMNSATMQSRIESSTAVNVNKQNNLKLAADDTYRLRAYRAAWQIINSDTANIMIEPDFHYNVISGGEHIRLTPAANCCTGNAKDNWMDITGVSEGVAVIEVSYDAIIIGGSGTAYTGRYGATDPNRTSLLVIQVGETGGTLAMKAKDRESIWDTELDTVYTLDDTASLSFSAELDGATPTVELSTDKGATWTSVAKDGDYFTAKGLVPGSNILRFTVGGKTSYQVIRAAKISCTYTNESRDSDCFFPGDKITVVFDDTYMAVPKFSGIYNPSAHTLVYGTNKSASKQCGGYDLPSKCAITVTMPGEAGEYSINGGYIQLTMWAAADPMGAHRILTDSGVGANFSAVSQTFVCGIYPDLSFTVTGATECEHEWGDCIVTKAHTAAKAGEKRYTCRLCGEYKFEATKKGACNNFAEEVTEQAPTCTEAGHTAGTRCSECWKVLSGMEEIPAKGHSFAEDWTTDETDHWHAATCEHTSEVSGKAAHSGGTATCTEKAVCAVCRASYGDFAEHVFDQKNTDEKYLKSAATCTAPAVYYKSCVCGAASETETFDFGNATGHSFSEEWTTDNDYHWHAATCGHDDEVSGKAAHDWDNGSVSGSIRTYTCKTCEKTKQETLRNYKTVLQETLTQLAKDVPAPAFGTGGGEWTVLALARGEYYPIDSTYFDGYYGRLANSVQETAASVGLDGALHKNKSTENSRVIIALSAIGKDARDVGGVDLVDAYSKNGFNWIQKQGINGPIFALIALDTVGYQKADTTLRQQCIDFILGKKLDDGGWALSGTSADPDITSMAIQALAAYQSDSKVKDALDDAVACLSAMQKDDGSFASWGAANAESIAQVIVALSALNIDADTDSRFVKNGHSALDALLQYYVEDKDGFAHVLTSGGGYTGGEVNAMATDQAAYALVAYDRMKIGKTRLYDMSDVKTDPEAQEYDALLERLKNLNVRNAKQRTYQDVQDAQKAYGSYLAGEEYPDLTKKQKDNLADAMDQILEDYEDCLQNAKIDWKSELLKRYQKIDQSKLSSADQKELNRLYQQALESLDNAKYEEQMENIVDQAEREMNNLGNSIRVSFRLIGCEQAAQDVNLSVSSYLPAYVTWIPTTTYTMKTGSTVYDVFMQAIRDNGLSQKGADKNYVESVQAPAVLGGYWLGEFDNGKNSGWMYTINGKHPGLGLKEQTIQNGDVIIWHYVNDYSHEVADWFNDPTHPALGDGTYYNGWLNASDITPEQYRKNGNGKSGNGSFRDVRISDWFYDDVNYVVEKGLFNGTSTTLFSPNVTMSRAMLVTVLYRLEGEPNVRGGSGFTDVPAGSWYANAVTWAADHGIVNGTSSTTFTPNADITREQMSAILYRYAAYKGYSIRSAASLSSYPDGAAVSSYARDAMAWAVGNGLIQGSGGKLMPGSGATRAQVAAILHRFCDRYVK